MATFSWLSRGCTEDEFNALKWWLPVLEDCGMASPVTLATLAQAGTLSATLVDHVGVDGPVAARIGELAAEFLQGAKARARTRTEAAGAPKGEAGGCGSAADDEPVEVFGNGDKAMLDFLAALDSDSDDEGEDGAGGESGSGGAHGALQGSAGDLLSDAWLRAVKPLYTMHFGAENVSLLLYSILRFVKPADVLEVGAGYTSAFLLQALADNFAELRDYERRRARPGGLTCEGQVWCHEPFFAAPCERPRLHCIDNMAHDATTAHRVQRAARALELQDHLVLHECDAFDPDLPATLEAGVTFDFMWIDLGAADRIERFFDNWWPRLRNGGYIAVHSSLTNQLTRDWLESRRSGERLTQCAPSLSFLEPHKLFQNAISIFQKREDGFAEPVYTKYP